MYSRLLVCLGLSAVMKSCYGAVFTPSEEMDIRSFINASMECRGLPGMTTMVVKGNEVWSSGFGTADFSTGRQVDSDDLFGIASLTKAFTGTLLGILLSENGYDWSTKVTDILGPEFGFIDSLRDTELTLRDLLSHRTGLARLDFALLTREGLPRVDLVKRIKYIPEAKPIRDGFTYSNYMYIMLGHVAEVLGQDTWENLVTSRLFEPLGMNSTRILTEPEDVLAAGVAKPYIYKDDQFEVLPLLIFDVSPEQPALGILSNANDMAKWMNFQLAKGKTEDGTQLIDEKLVADMQWVTTPLDSQNTIGNRFLTRPQYPATEIQLGLGYGWFVATYQGYKTLWHTGGLLAYTTLMWIYPDMDIGIFASVNGAGSWWPSMNHLTAVLYYLSDHLLELEPWLNETTACTFPQPWAGETEIPPEDPEVPITVENITEFEGLFSYPLFPIAEVTTNSTDLLMKMNALQGILHPSSEEDRFLWEITDPWEIATFIFGGYQPAVTFLRDNATGVVDSFRIEFDATLVFSKVTDGGESSEESSEIIW